MTFDGVSPDAMAAMKRLEGLTGPLKVTSAYRSPEHNASVGGAKGSQHLHGNAFDVSTAGMSQDDRIRLMQQARQAGFGGIGVYDNSLHFDVGAERAWGPSYGRDSLPEWAANALSGVAPPRPSEDVSDATMNKLAMLQMMPSFQNTLSPENFRYG